PLVSVLLSVMVPVTLKLIASPEEALAIAARNESGPLSFVFLTVIVAPTTGKALNSPRIRKLDRTEEKIEAGFLSITRLTPSNSKKYFWGGERRHRPIRPASPLEQTQSAHSRHIQVGRI